MNHENAVKKFMSEARERDPEKFAVVVHKYPVLSGKQLTNRRKREVPLEVLNDEIS